VDGKDSPRGTGPKRIRVLREDVSRKIAAGEVIDRPFSVVRELLDNALDAEASEVVLSIHEGGLARISVTDNGFGMAEEDLRLCYLSHSTSKVQAEADLYRITTLGFRGEALASIGTCARVEIQSKAAESPTASRITVQDGALVGLEPASGPRGTAVHVSELFAHMPARRAFLKSRSAESAACRTAFLDKALPHPSVAFRFLADDALKAFFPRQSLQDRVAAAHARQIPPAAFETVELRDSGFTARAVLARPEITNRDRRLLQIYINRRRIASYALSQAVEYAYSAYMPGGSFPAAFVFLDIDPELVDFNVHPAKKEARIKDQARIHRALAAGIREHLSRFAVTVEAGPGREVWPGAGGRAGAAGRGAARSGGAPAVGAPPARARSGDLPLDGSGAPPRASALRSTEWIGALEGADALPVPTDACAAGPYRYHGQIFRLFLLVEGPESLYIVDQHAAHERIIFEELRHGRETPQELLFPVCFDVSDREEEELLERLPRFAEMGIELERVASRSFEITALAPAYSSLEEGALVELLKAADTALERIEEQLYTMAACRTAIKDGEELDALTAGELIRKTLGLRDARCPHGRPIWHRVTREELFRLVKRT